MDLRALKGKCRDAVDVLVRDHGYRREHFSAADGSETFYAPPDLDAKHVRNGFIEPGVHKGTLIYWSRSSYEYDEWDCALPSEMLSQIEFWESLSDDDIKQMAGI